MSCGTRLSTGGTAPQQQHIIIVIIVYTSTTLIKPSPRLMAPFTLDSIQSAHVRAGYPPQSECRCFLLLPPGVSLCQPRQPGCLFSRNNYRPAAHLLLPSSSYQHWRIIRRSPWKIPGRGASTMEHIIIHDVVDGSGAVGAAHTRLSTTYVHSIGYHRHDTDSSSSLGTLIFPYT